MQGQEHPRRSMRPPTADFRRYHVRLGVQTLELVVLVKGADSYLPVRQVYTAACKMGLTCSFGKFYKEITLKVKGAKIMDATPQERAVLVSQGVFPPNVPRCAFASARTLLVALRNCNQEGPDVNPVRTVLLRIHKGKANLQPLKVSGEKGAA